MSYTNDSQTQSRFVPVLNKNFPQFAIIFGIVSVFLGIFVLILFVTPPPGVAPSAVCSVALIYLGATQLVYAFNGYNSSSWKSLHLITGCLAILFGFNSMISPLHALDFLAVYVGVVWVLRGIASLYFAFNVRGVGLEVYNFLIGIVLVISGLFILEMPIFIGLSIAFVGGYFGVVLMVTGLCEIVGGTIAWGKNRKGYKKPTPADFY